MTTPATLTLATWNLLHGISILGDGSDGQLSSSAQSLNTDVLAVQEVDCGSPRSGSVCHTEVIAQALDAQFQFCATLRGVPGESWTTADGHTDDGQGPRYGIGLVSKLPVREWHSLALPDSRVKMPLVVPSPKGPRFLAVSDEPRWGLAAVIEGANGPFTAVTTHLSFVPFVNLRQLRHLTKWLAQFPKPVFLLGDLNIPHIVMQRQCAWKLLAEHATYPVTHPRVQFDHIAVNRDNAMTPIATSAQALAVGDHRALTVTIPHP